MSDWRHWTTERGLRAESPPTLRLTTSIFDCFLRQLVPEALRTLALASWADLFERLAPLGDHEGEGLAPRAAEIQKLSPVMADVAAAGKQHAFFLSFLLAFEDLAQMRSECDGLYADSAPWSMACRRLLTFLEPRDAMRAAFQATIDGGI
jgi:hypothetical protein